MSRVLPRSFFRIGADPGAGIDRGRKGKQAELRHSAWAPVSAPWSALGFGLSRALSSARAVLQFEPVVPFTQTLEPRDRPTARLSRASRNRRSRSARRVRDKAMWAFQRSRRALNRPQRLDSVSLTAKISPSSRWHGNLCGASNRGHRVEQLGEESARARAEAGLGRGRSAQTAGR
jgi:hypothetical protein